MEYIQKMDSYMEEHRQEAFDLLVELAQIPAPSNHEELRAQFCRDWLNRQGADGVYIDEAQNVIYPIGVTDDKPIMVFMAHSDVVFPDTDPLPLRIEDDKIHCPGVGDDTANVVAMLMATKYIIEEKLTPKDCGLLVVVNSGEEGLGNLRGSRAILDTFGDRISEFVSFDGGCNKVTCRAVGSHRFKIEIDTEGGHSYGAFGNRNAIAYMASLIDSLYSMKVPEKGRTTYNVGTISGGTSVNTIAQHAEMLYEYRSDDAESLEIMAKHLDAALEYYRSKGVSVKSTLLGERPCDANVDQEHHDALKERAASIVERHYGHRPVYASSSTDCNIPLSRGIPAISTGCVKGKGAHTREEYVEISSLLPGLKQALEMMIYHF